MKLKHYVSIFVIAAAAVGYGCKGTDGAPGPQGPAGYNGVANMSIGTYLITSSSWVQYNSNTWYVATGAVIPTTDIINVYVSLNGSTYTPLATSSFFTSGDNLTYVFGNGGSVTLWEYFNSFSPAVNVYVEVADIPPAIYVKYPKANWNNYTEVSQLPEFKAALAKTTVSSVSKAALPAGK